MHANVASSGRSRLGVSHPQVWTGPETALQRTWSTGYSSRYSRVLGYMTTATNQAASSITLTTLIANPYLQQALVNHQLVDGFNPYENIN